jgi:Zn-dependent protease with chaperone function
LTGLPSTDKADYEKIYKERWTYIKEKFDKKEIYTNSAAQKYLDAIVQEIVQANPTLKGQSFQTYFSRSGIPNASYIGEGIILINMGLFHRLENESQAAFVISHEIAHFVLKHSDNAIKKYVTAINSKEVQQQLREIKGSEYRKREMLEKLVKGLSFSTRRHSRDREGEADSLAVELLRNTRFDISAAQSTLALLDTIDTDQLNTAACLEKLFNAKGYPFKKKWIAKEEGLLGGHAVLDEDAELEDSLKTHPDCSKRIKAIDPMVQRYLQGELYAQLVLHY